MSREKVFAAYKGDKFISVGTLKELSKELNTKISTLRFHSKPIYFSRTKEETSLRLYRVEED